MFKEIGSNFFLDINDAKLDENNGMESWFNTISKEPIYSSSGRGAISFVLNHLEKSSGVALLPIYTCDSVISPFRKKGYKVEFYDVEKDLTISEDKLNDCISLYNPTVILFHSYFGFDACEKIRTRIRSLRKQGITIIEDLTHSLFSGFKKIEADYHIASLRKWTAMPDGGVVFSDSVELEPFSAGTQDEMVTLNLKAFQKKSEYVKSLEKESKDNYRNLFSKADEVLSTDSEFYTMSEISLKIIRNTDFESMARIRKENYQYLLSAMSEIDYVKPLFPELPSAAVPLFFPVYVHNDRTELRSYLTENEVYTPVHWGIPEIFKDNLTSNATYIYNHILSIPIDQRYTLKDMNRIMELLKNYKAEKEHSGRFNGEHQLL